MNNLICGLALSCLLAPPVEKSDEATTHLYVRTTPAGAEIVLDGEPIGKSPGVFPVESGARRLVIELDGHVAKDQTITIRDGRVTRIELTLKPRPEGIVDHAVTFESIRVGKKLSDFPEPVDLSTPLSAWAAYTRASGNQDAKGIVDCSWVKIDPREMERFWTKGDPKDMAVYNEAQLESELVEVIIYRDKLATTISKLAFPPGVGRAPFSQRIFGLIDGKWKNLGENRCPSLEAAVTLFTHRSERLWNDYQGTVAERSGDLLQSDLLTNAGIKGRKVGKKVADFPERVDLSTPESACAAYHRASGKQDAQGVIDLSWVEIDPREMEQFWTKGDAKDMAVYNKAQLDAEILAVFICREKLADVVSRLEFPPGVGRHPYSSRTFGLIDGEWKNLGEDRCESLGVAAAGFARKRDVLWQQYEQIAEELGKSDPLKTPSADQSEKRQRHFVRLVVDAEKITFQAEETTWDDLPELLKKTPNRDSTVLEIARASSNLTVDQWDRARGTAANLAKTLGFEYLSEIGVHPLGSKGSPSQAVPKQESGAPISLNIVGMCG